MNHILLGIVFILAAVLLIWLGLRYRKNSYADYEKNSQKYTESTTMTVVHLEKSETQRWEDREDGSSELVREIIYTPTYEYTINGTTYRYLSNRSLYSKKDLGRTFTGYYDPSNPNDITENRPIKPVLGGFLFFVGAAVLLFLAVRYIQDGLFWIM